MKHLSCWLALTAILAACSSDDAGFSSGNDGGGSGAPAAGGSPSNEGGDGTTSGGPTEGGSNSGAGTSSGAGSGAGQNSGGRGGQASSGGGGGEPSEGGAGTSSMPPNIAVAVGYGLRRVLSTNGTSWTDLQQSTPNGGDDDDLFRGVTFANGRFVAVGGSDRGLSMISLDGRTWEHENREVESWIGMVTYMNGAFIAIGGDGVRIRSTDDGETWSESAGYQAIHYRDITSGEGIAVAVGATYDGVGIITTTRDGIDWQEVSNTGAGWRRVAYGNGVFVASGSEARVGRSENGTSWTYATAGTGNHEVVFANGEFILSNGPDGILRSTNGASWTPASQEATDVEGYFNGLYLAFGWPATIRTSPNLTSWTTPYQPGGSGFVRIALGRRE